MEEKEGEEEQTVVMLSSFPSAQSIATVLHRVGIHFNEFAFQERIILLGLVAHPFSRARARSSLSPFRSSFPVWPIDV